MSKSFRFFILASSGKAVDPAFEEFGKESPYAKVATVVVSVLVPAGAADGYATGLLVAKD